MGVTVKMLNLNKIKICLFPWTWLPLGRLCHGSCRLRDGPGCAVSGALCGSQRRAWPGGCRGKTILSLWAVCFSAALPRLQGALISIRCPVLFFFFFLLIHPPTVLCELRVSAGWDMVAAPFASSATTWSKREHLRPSLRIILKTAAGKFLDLVQSPLLSISCEVTVMSILST